MKRIVKYTAIDPYYSDVIQTYIGMTSEEIDNIQYETEEYMGQYYVNGIHNIYTIEIIKNELNID